MKLFLGLLITLFLLTSGIVSSAEEDFVIYDGNKLTDGFDLGVDSSEHRYDWVKNKGNEFEISYPDGQTWGAVFITVGPPTSVVDERGTVDFTAFGALEISMKGAKGNEIVEIGIKDKTDEDDGSETISKRKLSDQYAIYRFPLRNFKTADLNELYVVTEFVFKVATPTTIYFNSIKYTHGKGAFGKSMLLLLLGD